MQCIYHGIRREQLPLVHIYEPLQSRSYLLTVVTVLANTSVIFYLKEPSQMCR